MDLTLLTILFLLVFASVVALLRARKRDKCLRGFEDFHVSLAEQEGDLSWGRLQIYTSGLIINYVEPILARLPDRDRRLLLLRASGLSYQEIAEMTGLRRSSIGRLLARATRRAARAHRIVGGRT